MASMMWQRKYVEAEDGKAFADGPSGNSVWNESCTVESMRLPEVQLHSLTGDGTERVIGITPSVPKSASGGCTGSIDMFIRAADLTLAAGLLQCLDIPYLLHRDFPEGSSNL